MIDVTVIVVNWNAREDLRLCLESLFPMPPSPVSYEVWVVDNASTDGSAAMVAASFPGVVLITNSENTGFSKANNQAIAASKSRYAFLLNSDAAILPGALAALVQYADANPTAGVVGPKVLNADGSLQLSCRRWPSLKAGLFRNTLLGRLFPKNKYALSYLMADFDHAQTAEVNWLSGCAMFLRRDMLDRMGTLDERFYMYCEDVEICWRAWAMGWRVIYNPTAVVTHAIGRSSDKNADKMIVEFHKSWYELFKIMHPKGGPLRRGAAYSGLWLRAAVRIARRHWAKRGETSSAEHVLSSGDAARRVAGESSGDGK